MSCSLALNVHPLRPEGVLSLIHTDVEKPYRIIPHAQLAKAPHPPPRSRIKHVFPQPSKSQLNPHPAEPWQLVITMDLTLACTPSLIWEISLRVRGDKSFPLYRSSIADFESPFLCLDQPASNRESEMKRSIVFLFSFPFPAPPRLGVILFSHRSRF